MTFQLPSKDEKAGYVLKQFDRIARKYDLANDLISFGMHRLWKRRAIRELLITTESRANPAGSAHSTCCQESSTSAQRAVLACGSYLDVCTGTGDLALLIASETGSAGRVIGLDFSAEMLSVAKRRSAINQTLATLSFQQGDALRLPFPENSFDGAIISFGLRNLTDLQLGLNEMSRVVKAGGKVMSLDLGQPDMPVFTPLFLLFFDKIVPLIGDWILQDRQAYTYLPESRKNYPHPLRLNEMFAEAGLLDVRWFKLALGSVALHVGTVK